MDDSASWVKLYRTPLPLQNNPTGSGEQLLISKHWLARIWMCDPALIEDMEITELNACAISVHESCGDRWKKEMVSS